MNFLNILIGLPIRLLFYIPGWVWGHVSAGFMMGYIGSRSYDNRWQAAPDETQETIEPGGRKT
jgi:hypothetical protein